MESLVYNTLRSTANARVVYTTDAKQLHMKGTIIYSKYRIFRQVHEKRAKLLNLDPAVSFKANSALQKRVPGFGNCVC